MIVMIDMIMIAEYFLTESLLGLKTLLALITDGLLNDYLFLFRLRAE